MATDSERLDWFLSHTYVDHEYGDSYITSETCSISDGMKHFEKWERACISGRNKRRVLLATIDAAIQAEPQTEFRGKK